MLHVLHGLATTMLLEKLARKRDSMLNVQPLLTNSLYQSVSLVSASAAQFTKSKILLQD